MNVTQTWCDRDRQLQRSVGLVEDVYYHVMSSTYGLDAVGLSRQARQLALPAITFPSHHAPSVLRASALSRLLSGYGSHHGPLLSAFSLTTTAVTCETAAAQWAGHGNAGLNSAAWLGAA